MGSSCTCNCVRTTPEPSLDEESTPSSSAPKGPSGGVLDEVRVPMGPGGTVPAVAKLWASQQGWRRPQEAREGTPRFEEVPQQAARSGRSEPRRTPGRPASGDGRSFGWTPRDSPRRTARSAEEEEDDSAEVYYEGAYLDSKRHGVGTLRMKSCTYVGDFWHGEKQGKAILTWDDGREYKGQFRRGEFDGAAVMTWPDGRRYTGQYAENQKHGSGTFLWQDGRCYDGQWVSGKRHGVGTYTNAKGLSRRGTWHLDRPVHWEGRGAEEAPLEDAGARVSDV